MVKFEWCRRRSTRDYPFRLECILDGPLFFDHVVVEKSKISKRFVVWHDSSIRPLKYISGKKATVAFVEEWLAARYVERVLKYRAVCGI